jgi:hypothetical protein
MTGKGNLYMIEVDTKIKKELKNIDGSSILVADSSIYWQ